MDQIERRAAIDAIGKCTDIYVNNLPTMVDKAEAYKALNEVPSAQPEPLVKESRTLVNDLVNDTISRQAAIENTKRIPDLTVYAFCSFIDMLNNLPSVQGDLVEIVRCKDCKYNSCSPEHGNACCDNFYGMTDQMGFCHYGERRTDD